MRRGHYRKTMETEGCVLHPGSSQDVQFLPDRPTTPHRRRGKHLLFLHPRIYRLLKEGELAAVRQVQAG